MLEISWSISLVIYALYCSSLLPQVIRGSTLFATPLYASWKRNDRNEGRMKAPSVPAHAFRVGLKWAMCLSKVKPACWYEYQYNTDEKWNYDARHSFVFQIFHNCLLESGKPHVFKWEKNLSHDLSLSIWSMLWVFYQRKGPWYWYVLEKQQVSFEGQKSTNQSTGYMFQPRVWLTKWLRVRPDTESYILMRSTI